MTRSYRTLYEETNTPAVTHINDWLDGTTGIQYAYDALGRLTSIIEYDVNKQLSYTYDAAERMESMTLGWLPSDPLVTQLYLVMQLLAKLYFASFSRAMNGVRCTSRPPFPHSGLQNAILRTSAFQNSILERVWSGTRTEYDYDERNRLVVSDDSYWTYTYDNRDRLFAVLRRTGQGNWQHWFSYVYDNADNMTQRLRFQASDSQTDVWNYVYNTANEQISMTLNGGTPETRTYDNWGRLAARAQGGYSAFYAYRYGSRRTRPRRCSGQ